MLKQISSLRSILVGIMLGLAFGPLRAEACGAYIPQEGEADRAQERGLILWDGQLEQIMMELDVTSDAREAAWIFPTPSPATVELGDARLFDELEDLTKPRIVIEHRPGSLFEEGRTASPAGGAPPVTVLSQQTLGPFEVTTLAASEAGALQRWLADHGYAFPEGLDSVLEPYVENGWYYAAARLTPESQGQPLTGQLDPLWIKFQSDQIIYIMRTAAIVPNPFPLSLYVFAEHRVEKAQSSGFSQVAFADFVDPADLAPGAALARTLPGRLFLTKFRESVEPARADADYTFTYAPTDETYHEVITEVRYDDYSWMAWLAGLAACCVLGLGAVGVGALVLVLRRSRPAA